MAVGPDQAAAPITWSTGRVTGSDASQAESVLLMDCPTKGTYGTGFVLRGAGVVTCQHVVADAAPNAIAALRPDGSTVAFSKVRSDSVVDLALLTPTVAIAGGLDLADSEGLKVGSTLRTWGHPLGFRGPAPLLSVGYLAGITKPTGPGRKRGRLVVNAAFNKGNSGGPLFCGESLGVVGVVVTKHTPLTPFIASAMRALANNKSGVVFSGQRSDGSQANFVESQVVVEVLEFYRQLSQYMIGEAIPSEDIRDFVASGA